MELLPFELENHYYFATVMERRGSPAAVELIGVPKSFVSLMFSDPEASLGTRLFQRSSRKQVLMEARSEFYSHSVVMLKQAHLAHVGIQNRVGAAIAVQL